MRKRVVSAGGRRDESRPCRPGPRLEKGAGRRSAGRGQRPVDRGDRHRCRHSPGDVEPSPLRATRPARTHLALTSTPRHSAASQTGSQLRPLVRYERRRESSQPGSMQKRSLLWSPTPGRCSRGHALERSAFTPDPNGRDIPSLWPTWPASPSARPSKRAGKGSSGSVQRSGCRIRSCDTLAYRWHEPAAPKTRPSTS